MMSHQTPEEQPDATRPIQTKDHLKAPQLYGKATRFAFEQSHTPNSGSAYDLGHSDTLYAQQPLGRISLNAGAHVGHGPQATSYPSYPSTSVTTFSNAPLLGLFNPESPFALGQAAFGGMINHPVYRSTSTTEPPAARSGSMRMPSTSGVNDARASQAGPSNQQRGPAKGRTKRRSGAKKTASNGQRGHLRARRDKAWQDGTISDRPAHTTSYPPSQTSVSCHEVGEETVLLPAVPPMSDEEFKAFQADSLSQDYAASLAAMFEAPLAEEEVAQIACDSRGFLVLGSSSQRGVFPDSSVGQTASAVGSVDRIARSSSSKHSLSSLPAQNVESGNDGGLATDLTLDEVDSSPADGFDSHTNNNILTDTTGAHKPHTKHERPLALERLRNSRHIRGAIEADITTFKAAFQTSRSTAIAALPVYMERFRPEVESELARQPAVPETLTRRQRADKAQPCLLCGVPIHGRGYAMTANHRTRCKVMMALVEEQCVMDFLDAKNVDMSWKALRQLIPGFVLPKKQGVMPTPMNRQGGMWHVVKDAMAAEAANMVAKGAVVIRTRPESVDSTEAKADSSRVAGTSGKRKRDDVEGFDVGPVGSAPKRTYAGPSGLTFEGSSRANTEGKADGE